MIEILVDFNSSLHQKDDQLCKPIDWAFNYANANAKVINPLVLKIYRQDELGQLVRSINKYYNKSYVKYLQPVDQIEELNIFFEKVKDMKNIDLQKMEKTNSSREFKIYKASKTSFSQLF